jgi:DNA polymerase III alpha subunit
MGFDVVPVDVNHSGHVWEIKGNNTLVQPLSSIKGLGEKASEQIIEHRPFNTIEEFLFHDKIVYSKLNKKALDVLVRSEALSSLMDSRFENLKHFWKAVAAHRPKKAAKLVENIEKYKDTKDYTKKQRIENLAGLTGLYPFRLVISEDTVSKLKRGDVPPLSEYDPAAQVTWFIPRNILVKKTKNGKSYWIVECIDVAGGTTSIKCWGIDPRRDRITLDAAYMAHLDHSEQWGFSSSLLG